MLDDIYEKVEPPDLQPTWRIQTKPGSEQWGYQFEAPLRDARLFDAMIRTACTGGISDPGMRNIVRWARIPGSRPRGKRHRAALVHFKPTWCFPAGWDLMEALGVFQRASEVPAGRFRPMAKAENLGEIEDPVVDWLIGQHKVGSLHCGDGWIEIQCPWGHEHSNGDERAYYLPTRQKNRQRGFNCFHSHTKTIADFLGWVREAGGPVVHTSEAHDLSALKEFFG